MAGRTGYDYVDGKISKKRDLRPSAVSFFGVFQCFVLFYNFILYASGNKITLPVCWRSSISFWASAASFEFLYLYANTSGPPCLVTKTAFIFPFIFSTPFFLTSSSNRIYFACNVEEISIHTYLATSFFPVPPCAAADEFYPTPLSPMIDKWFFYPEECPSRCDNQPRLDSYHFLYRTCPT